MLTIDARLAAVSPATARALAADVGFRCTRLRRFESAPKLHAGRESRPFARVCDDPMPARTDVDDRAWGVRPGMRHSEFSCGTASATTSADMRSVLMIDEPLSRSSRAVAEAREKRETVGWGVVWTVLLGVLIVGTHTFVVAAAVTSLAYNQLAGIGGAAHLRGDAAKFLESIATDGFYGSIAASIAAIFCIGMIVAVTRIRARDHGEYLALRITPMVPVIGWAMAIVGLQLLWLYAPKLGIGTEVSEYVVDVYRSGAGQPIMWAAYVILIPLYEEIFARGFLFAGLERSRFGAWGAVIFTTLFWTVMHVQYGALELVQVASAGVLFGLARLHTGSVFPPLVMHAVVNFLALYLVSHRLPF